jgi:hypothetical protein
VQIVLAKGQIDQLPKFIPVEISPILFASITKLFTKVSERMIHLW